MCVHIYIYINICKKWNITKASVQFSSVAQSCPTLRPHESQHTRPPCPSPTSGVYSNSCPSSWWCHPAISSSVIPFSSCPQSLPASGSFPMSQLFSWGCQSIGVSALASVLPMNTQDWCPLKNKMLLFATIWMELEDIILDEISERKSNTVMFSLYGESKNQNEWTNKAETYSRTWRISSDYHRERGSVGGKRDEGDKELQTTNYKISNCM